MPFTVRGTCQVRWNPAYTLVLASADGTTLKADGKTHSLTATLTRTSTGAAVTGRKIQLNTSPSSRAGNGKVAWTDGSGVARFDVSDTDDETVAYTGKLLPGGNPTADLSIVWTGSSAGVRFCNVIGTAAAYHQNTAGAQPNWAAWWMRYVRRRYTDAVTFTIISDLVVGEAVIYSGSFAQGNCASLQAFITTSTGGGTPDYSGFGCRVTDVGQEVVDIQADHSAYDAALAAASATVTAGACS